MGAARALGKTAPSPPVPHSPPKLPHFGRGRGRGGRGPVGSGRGSPPVRAPQAQPRPHQRSGPRAPAARGPSSWARLRRGPDRPRTPSPLGGALRDSSSGSPQIRGVFTGTGRWAVFPERLDPAGKVRALPASRRLWAPAGPIPHRGPAPRGHWRGARRPAARGGRLESVLASPRPSTRRRSRTF